MAAFDLVPNPPLVSGWTRLFLSGAGGREEISIHTNAKIKLRQSGDAGAAGTMPAIYSVNPPIAEISDVRGTGNDTQTFTLEAKGGGKTVLNGKTPTGVDCVYLLNVIAGNFENHSGMSVDLLALKLGRSNDAFKIYCLQRLLNNNHDDTNLFDQQSTRNVTKFGTKLACGSVCQDVGSALFGSVSLVYSSYHKPVKAVTNRDDIKYDQNTIDKARRGIKDRLTKGQPVRVGTAHHFTTSMLQGGALQPTSGGGHFCLIVGCNDPGDRFLYVDPWFKGSELKYEGGISLNKATTKCQFLGSFVLQNTSSRGPVLIQDTSTSGTFNGPTLLEIIAGPL